MGLTYQSTCQKIQNIYIYIYGFGKISDIGHMSTDGYVKIVDRKKDMILVSGFNVYPN